MRALSPSICIDLMEQGEAGTPVARCVSLLAAAEEQPPAVVAQLPLGTRDAGLFSAWRAWFGEEIPCLDSCPACRETLAFTLPVAALLSSVDSAQPSTRLLVEKDGYAVQLRLLTSEDLSAVVGLRPSAAERGLLQRAVVQATREGAGMDTSALPPEIVEAVASALAEADPQAEILLNLSCIACGESWQALLDIGEHLWRRVEERARAALYEIHMLAAAYGWDETQILALSPWRRRRYLDLVGA